MKTPWQRRARTNIEISICSLLIPLAVTAVGSSVLTFFVRNLISGERKVKQQITRLYATVVVEFELSVSELPGHRPSVASGLGWFITASKSFRQCLQGIAREERTICFKTYNYWRGESTGQFFIAPSAKAGEGVKEESLRRIQKAEIEG